jgi:hypothetical protein
VTVCRPQVVKNYGVRPNGTFGVRGWRVYCGTCDHLGVLRGNYFTAQQDKASHRAGRTVKARKAAA